MSYYHSSSSSSSSSYVKSSSSSISSSGCAKSSSSFGQPCGQMSSQVVNRSAVCSGNPSVSITSYTTRSPMACTGVVRTHRYYKTQSAIVKSEPWYHQLSHTYTTGRITSNMGTLVLNEAQVINNEEQPKLVSSKSVQQECGKMISKSVL